MIVFKMFSSKLNRKALVSTFFRFEERFRFRKVPFLLQVRVDGSGPNRRCKNAFTDFSDVVRTGPNYSIDQVLFVEKDTNKKL